jgi:hypothetical protein
MVVRIQLEDQEGIDRVLRNFDQTLANKIKEKYFKYGKFAIIEVDSQTLEAKIVSNKD